MSEDVGSEDLALYVCLTADSIDRPFTATITPQSGTAIGICRNNDKVANPMQMLCSTSSILVRKFREH